jgi:hypothetical protein
MKRLDWMVACVLGTAVLAQAQYKGKWVGWSTGYIFTGSTNQVAWKCFTHMCNFQVTVSGSGALGAGNLAVGNSAFVSACHQNNVKAIVCIGGQGQSGNFSSATSKPSSQTALVQNIVELVKTGGYDGVDMDWEVGEQGDGPALVAKFKSLHKELREAIDKMSPKPMMTAAVATDWYPNSTAAIAEYVDQLNNMSYYDRVNKMDGLFAPVLKLGVPKSIQGVGFGFDSDGEVKDVADIAAKCRYAIDGGFGGIMIWDVTHAPASTMDTVARYVSLEHASAAIAPQAWAASGAKVTVFGGSEVAYELPASGKNAFVDLGVYDLRGNLVKTLVRGHRPAGAHSVTWDKKNGAGAVAQPGTYFVRLTGDNVGATAKLVLVR